MITMQKVISKKGKIIKIGLICAILVTVMSVYSTHSVEFRPHSEPTYRFYEDSEYYNVKEAIFIITLGEGSYVLMYDNTGFIGNENTNDVSITASIRFDKDIDPLVLELDVTGSGWGGSGFRLYYTNPQSIGFHIISTGKVSLFLTLRNETNTFEEEVKAYEAEQSTDNSNSFGESVISAPTATSSTNSSIGLENEKEESNDSFILAPWNFVIVLAIFIFTITMRKIDI